MFTYFLLDVILFSSYIAAETLESITPIPENAMSRSGRLLNTLISPRHHVGEPRVHSCDSDRINIRDLVGPVGGSLLTLMIPALSSIIIGAIIAAGIAALMGSMNGPEPEPMPFEAFDEEYRRWQLEQFHHRLHQAQNTDY